MSTTQDDAYHWLAAGILY